MATLDYIPKSLHSLYEIHEFHHAAVILKHEYPAEFDEICRTLEVFRLTVKDIKTAGGNESTIPKLFNRLLRPLGWTEQKLNSKMVAKVGVDTIEVNHDTHLIDYVKGKVAFDLEWNSKDQTFDRDLYAFSAYYLFGHISAGVIVTRSTDLNILFDHLGVKSKYGASTTHVDKLLPRLRAGRNGGCPILVFGIKRNLVSDAPKYLRRKSKRGKKKKL